MALTAYRIFTPHGVYRQPSVQLDVGASVEHSGDVHLDEDVTHYSAR
jgi:hypothetical protein